jgi:hypothetical protein
MIDTAQRRDECGSDGVGLRTQSCRLLAQTDDLRARCVACRHPLVVAVFVVVEVDAIEPDQERDVKFAQFDEETSGSSRAGWDELLTPREEREMRGMRQVKTSFALPVALGFATKAQDTQFAFP